MPFQQVTNGGGIVNRQDVAGIAEHYKLRSRNPRRECAEHDGTGDAVMRGSYDERWDSGQ